jgi:hypothetical protein
MDLLGLIIKPCKCKWITAATMPTLRNEKKNCFRCIDDKKAKRAQAEARALEKINQRRY